MRAFIEAHADSRFAYLRTNPGTGEDIDDPLTRTIHRAGYRRSLVGGGWEYLVFEQAFKNEVCQSLDHRRVAKALAAHGFLVPDTDGRPAKKVCLPDGSRPRVYIIRGTILGDEPDFAPVPAPAPRPVVNPFASGPGGPAGPSANGESPSGREMTPEDVRCLEENGFKLQYIMTPQWGAPPCV